MSGSKSDCRKFSPNVFNKTKCQNCFRTKDSHSAEALENNRASRNVSKCGYLFVAPDWDFTVSINRTKRWQRRWFVLYDDGELTYALDEFPDTIPQGTIDMNKVLDVSDAEGITGNDFAISITTPEKVHFIKGTSKEESKWWFDVLCKVSPRYISRVKHKRNATFPCGKATIPPPAVINQEYCSEDDMRLNTFPRPKFLSTSEMAQEWIPTTSTDGDEDVFSSKENNSYNIGVNSNNKMKRDVEVHNALNKLISLPEDTVDDADAIINDEAILEKAPKDYLSELEESENRRRNRRYLKRENRIQRSQRSRNDGVSKMIPSKSTNKSATSDCGNPIQNNTSSAMAAAEKLEYLESIHTKNDKFGQLQKDCCDELDSLSQSVQSTNEDQATRKTNLRKSESLKNIPTEMESEVRDHTGGLRRYHSFKGPSTHRKLKSLSGTSSLKRMKSSATGLPKASSTPTNSKSSDSVMSSANSNISQSLNNTCDEELKEGAFTRNGWLMRQTLSKDWSRHWFVLKDSSLTYYRDPSAEHCGIMDGILDLNQVSTIREQESDRYYAISLQMWDGKKHVLAAETDEFRNMWVHALQYAANLWSSASKEDFICTEIILPEHTFHHNDRSERISSPSSLQSLYYTEENPLAPEYSSYSSDDQSEYFSLVDEDEISDLSSSPRTLPPSPPINRNVISLVKEKSRTRCNYGSKTNSPPISCIENTRDFDKRKNKETLQSQDHSDKNGTKALFCAEGADIDLLVEELVEEDGRPLSPITPPVEFMSDLQEELFPKESVKDPVLTEKEHLHIRSASNERGKYGSEEKVEACSICLSMRSKLIRAQEEIKKLRRELKEAHANFDNLEMFSFKLTQDMKLKEENYNSQIALMTAKIDDLTSKFTFAEKNYRQLKQKVLKNEGKERRRSSLKNREGLSITKEYETKLCELENKINSIEMSCKRDSFADEESEKSFSDTSSRLNESFIGTSESSETNTPTEAAANESKGFFSRLQSLMSKVENVNSHFSIKENSENISLNPKILVKNNDELSSLDETDEWISQSPNNIHSSSGADLDNFSHPIADYPKNLSECQIMLSQKLNNHLSWLKHSLYLICEKERNELECQNEQLVLVNNLVRELNELNQENTNFQNEEQSLLLLQAVKALENINTIGSFDSWLKATATRICFKIILQTLCIAFVEYESVDLPAKLVFNIPQFSFFCPSVNKLFPELNRNYDVLLDLTHRLQLIENESQNNFSMFNRAKFVRYERLWNILTEVPVQDDHLKKPAELNSMLTYVTSIATDVHRIAELQLSGLSDLPPNKLTLENESLHKWRKECCKVLNDNLASFLDELKEKCPMVNESTVSFYKLKEATRKGIVYLILELSFLNVCSSLFELLIKYYSKVNKSKEESEESNFLCRKKWLQPNENHFFSNACIAVQDSFHCPQCTLLNDLIHSKDHLKWEDFVNKYNYFNIRKINKYLKLDAEISLSASANPCLNCNNNLSESQVKNKKDVCNNVTCAQCDSWIQKFCNAEKQHELEQRTLELKHNAELKQLEECIIKSSEIHEQEMLQKQNELLALSMQLQRLKTEYEEQKQLLKDLYEEKLNFDCENIDEESIKETYRMEIEDLKDMFKQGLLAIENSHNRITSEMEKRHNEEIALLEAEKEKALELEAQATYTALEAIKKSHAEQLEEETASIKQELMNKFQKEEGENFYTKYINELEELKAEILKMTDMYSSKCLENVALEEKINSLRQQLKEAHDQLCKLVTKNKEISISLAEEPET